MRIGLRRYTDCSWIWKEMAVAEGEGRLALKDAKNPPVNPGEEKVAEGKQARVGGLSGFLNLLETRGDVELRGSTPVPYEERTETKYLNIFTLWFSMSCNPLPYASSIHYTSTGY